MKIWKNILITVLVILVLSFTAAYILVAVKGRVLFTQALEGALNKRVNIGYLGLKMPLALEIADLEVEDLGNIDYIYCSPNLFGLLSGKIILNKVVVLRPQINLVTELPVKKAAQSRGKEIAVATALTQAQEVLDATGTGSKAPPKIIVNYLKIKDGVINFSDRIVSESGLQITIKDILLDVNNLSFAPESGVADFQLMAKIPWGENSGQAQVYTSGWMDLCHKNMQARLEVTEIDGVYLYPYYSKWVDLENARIEEASFDFISDIQGQDNDLTAKCRLELTDIKFRPRPPEESEHKAEKITTAVLGIFRALNQGKVILHFTIKTKMDKPNFSFSSINQAVEKTLMQAIRSDQVNIEDLAALPAKFLEGLAKGTSGATRAIINGAVSVGRSLLEALKTAAESETEETPQQQ